MQEGKPHTSKETKIVNVCIENSEDFVSLLACESSKGGVSSGREFTAKVVIFSLILMRLKKESWGSIAWQGISSLPCEEVLKYKQN